MLRAGKLNQIPGTICYSEKKKHVKKATVVYYNLLTLKDNY